MILLLGQLASGTELGGGEDSARDFVWTFFWPEMAIIRQCHHFDMFGDQRH
jgi:hypothetical protein